MFIYIEGMDLSGKTTLANNLKDILGDDWIVQSNALTKNNPVWLLADVSRKNRSLDEDIVGYLYSIATMIDVRRFILPNGFNVIQDSTVVMRSLAYHSILGTPTILEQLKESVSRIPSPDFTFYLSADLDARVSRLHQRELENPEDIAPDDLMIINNPERFIEMERMLCIFVTEYFKPKIIETSSMTKEEVCAFVLKEIGRKKDE